MLVSRASEATAKSNLPPPVDGADLRAALDASCFLGALPPVLLRAVLEVGVSECLVQGGEGDATTRSSHRRQHGLVQYSLLSSGHRDGEDGCLLSDEVEVLLMKVEVAVWLDVVGKKEEW